MLDYPRAGDTAVAVAIDAFHAGLTNYLDWWNTTRIQERPDYLGPDEYRAQQTAIA